jgi:dUTP pyrophosphatase
MTDFRALVASTITLVQDDPPYAKAYLPFGEAGAAGFRPRPEIDGDYVIWRDGDALYILNELWPLIKRERPSGGTFAKRYGGVWGASRGRTIKAYRMAPTAVTPSNYQPVDSGFDLTITHVLNPNYGPGVVLFGTQLRIKPPFGYYLELLPRSSLCRLGWGLANSVGVIDATYGGEVGVLLYKLSPEARALELPLRAAQLILRELLLADMVEVEEQPQGQRGGFGSTG